MHRLTTNSGQLLAWGLTIVLTTSMAQGAIIEGFVEPYREIVISSTSEPGVVRAIAVQEGDRVEAGDEMAQLDTSVLQASLSIAKQRATMRGKLIAAQTELKIRKRQLGKLRMLRVDGHATQAEIDRAESDLSLAESDVMRAQEEIELNELECERIQAQIQQRVFRSPVAGVVTEVHREVGEATQIGDPRIMTVVQLNLLRVRFSVSVSQANSMTAGDVLPVHLAELNRDVELTIESISPVLDAKSGTQRVTCVIDNSQGKLRSGMRCLLTVAGDPTYEELVPVSAR